MNTVPLRSIPWPDAGSLKKLQAIRTQILINRSSLRLLQTAAITKSSDEGDSQTHKEIADRPGKNWSPNKLYVEPHLAIGTPIQNGFVQKMILASAGTGKTYSLAARAVRLLFPKNRSIRF